MNYFEWHLNILPYQLLMEKSNQRQVALKVNMTLTAAL